VGAGASTTTAGAAADEDSTGAVAAGRGSSGNDTTDAWVAVEYPFERRDTHDAPAASV
jgi:hypothetical protein